jgi:hypothetical protein
MNTNYQQRPLYELLHQSSHGIDVPNGRFWGGTRTLDVRGVYAEVCIHLGGVNMQDDTSLTITVHPRPSRPVTISAPMDQESPSGYAATITKQAGLAALLDHYTNYAVAWIHRFVLPLDEASR